MVRNVTALLRSLNQDGKRLLDLRLPEIVAQTLRPQAAIESKVVFGQVRRDRTLRGVGRTDGSRRRRPAIEAGTRFEHHSLYFHSISQSSSSVIHIIRVALPSPNAKQCPCTQHRHAIASAPFQQNIASLARAKTPAKATMQPVIYPNVSRRILSTRFHPRLRERPLTQLLPLQTRSPTPATPHERP